MNEKEKSCNNWVSAYKGGFPDIFSEFACDLQVISDQNVIENGTRFNLPQVKTDSTDLVTLVQLGIGRVFGINDLRMDPWSFVVGIVDLFWFPFTLKNYIILKSIADKKKTW